tara:strand:- start:458 stop:811 length:354 start_codon:yes stop_codon:yes gene_type:complete
VINKNKVAEYELAKARIEDTQRMANAILSSISPEDKQLVKDFEEELKGTVKGQLTHNYGKVYQESRENLQVPYMKFSDQRYIGADLNTLEFSAHGVLMQARYRKPYSVKETIAVKFK